MRSFLIAGLVVVLPAFAGAEPPAPVEAPDGVLTYAVFEGAVPHVELAQWPERLAGDNRFCRLTLAEAGLAVWAFSPEGDQNLLAVLALDPEAEGGLRF